MRFIISLLLGGVAGYVAGILMGTKKNGALVNIIIGFVGGILGSLVAGLIGLGANNMIGGFIISVVGACLLIWLLRKVLKVL